MAKCTTTCFGQYWAPSGCPKRNGLGSRYMHCARTRGVEISTYGFFIYKRAIRGGVLGTPAHIALLL